MKFWTWDQYERFPGDFSDKSDHYLVFLHSQVVRDISLTFKEQIKPFISQEWLPETEKWRKAESGKFPSERERYIGHYFRWWKHSSISSQTSILLYLKLNSRDFILNWLEIYCEVGFQVCFRLIVHF